ncbi:hypothetical protein [[Collinsella] massiliensis]|uniref:Glycosyltransferase RgtA/B/C/D-like domain-containing protein n=1 Tax=[Collinsella] massiliensis TaxID=1232426 RepID=A0A1Y3XZI8_9ACTN|nr:hypothetical protein [[Collinsella] massiliensis]OUN88529.1 hypothetical protein B5G02_06365 [[Collinsella] massiliensis]
MAEIGKHVKPVERAQDEPAAASARTVAACLAVSVAIVALICLVQVPKYAMPDDFMQDLYARGAYLDTPGFLMLYSLVGFSAPISWLYALLPAVPWYPVALLGLIAISFAAVGVTAVSARVPAPLKVFLAGALALCEVMATVYLTYTIVAFIACAAGVVLVLRRAAFCRPQGFRASDVLAFALIVEGFSLRPESGAAALVLFVPFLVWALACNRNARMMAFAVGVVAAMGLSYAAGQVAWRITPGWEEFQQTFKAAQAVADYPVVDYEDVQQVAPELSQTDVDMIYEFIFVDADTYSLETFQALDGVVEGYGLATMLAGMVARVSFTAFAFGLLVVLAATAGFICAARRLPAGACAVAWAIPALALAEFLLIFLRARLKIHVFLPVFIVALFALVVCCLIPARRGGDPRAERPLGVFLGRVVPAAGVLAYAAVLGLLWVTYVRPLQASLGNELTANTEAYLASHEDQLVLFTNTQGIVMNDDIFSFDAWRQPDNAVFIGGYEYYTPSWETFLTREGLTRDGFLLNLIDNDDMVTASYPEQAELIATYLSEHSGQAVEAERVETLGETTSGDEDVCIWRYRTA